MSCETENIEYWRLVNKYTTISGVVPTIPPSQDHNDGTWNATDIYIGELFINTTDDKIWMRTENGIRQISGTGGTGSTINDYVSASMGGTFSGPIYAPTMSANGMTAFIISASAFDGLYFGSSASTFYGDGSNLTGINVEWNGGTVSNPTYFANQVELGDVILNGPISTGNSYIDIIDDVWVTGGMSASYFVGDGSLLTGIIAATGPNYYTDAANLVGATIVFDRTDATGAYSVDLTPIISTQSINTFTWDNTTNLLELTTIGGSSFQILINEFNDLSVTNGITADTVTANNFYGTFTGAFTDDVYTTNAELDGTTAVFYRTDGASYSIDLSPISATGSGAGATGLGGVLSIDNNTNGNDINLNDGDQIISDDTQKIIEFQEERILIQNEYTTTEYTYTGLLEVKNDFRTSQLAHIRTDLTSGDTLTTGVQIDDTTATITSNNVTTTNEAFVRADSGSGTVPLAEVRLWTSDFFGNASYMTFNPGNIEVVGSSSDGFGGIEYGDDYSTDYTNRSLVDKEYVDNAVSGSTLTIEQVLKNGNTTGTQSIYISSSASQINGYNGVSQHWYDAANPLAGNYFRIENGTGSSASFIQLMDSLRGDIQLYQGNAWNLSSDDAYRTNIYMGGNTQIATENRDFLTNTFWYKSIAAVVGNGTSNETRDLLNDTSAQVATYTDGTGTDTHVLIQSYHNGGAVAGQIYVRQNELTLKAEDNNISSSNITMDYTTLLLEAKDLDLDTGTSIEMMSTFISVAGTNPTFQGIEYSTDYSANFTNRTLVDKEYVDTAIAGLTGGGGTGATPSLAQVLTTGNIASTDIDMNQYQIQNVSVIDADGNVGIHTINMINASLLTLMYNT